MLQFSERTPLFVFFIVFGLSSGLVALLTPLAIRSGKRWGLVDIPGGRRKHVGHVVRIGGLGLYPGFAVAALVPLLLRVPRQDPLEVIRLTGVLLGMGVVWITGLLDDRFNLPFWGQLAGIALASLIAMFFKVFIEIFNNQALDKLSFFNSDFICYFLDDFFSSF